MKQLSAFSVAFFLLLLSLTVYGQSGEKSNVKLDSTALQAAPDTAKVTWSKVYTDTKDALKGIGEALKIGSEHVYSILIKQQMVVSISYLIIIAVLAFLCTFLWKLFLRDRARMSKEGDSWYRDCVEDHGVTVVYLILSVISTVAVAIVVGTNFERIITGFVNPEYGAIHTILDKLSEK